MDYEQLKKDIQEKYASHMRYRAHNMWEAESEGTDEASYQLTQLFSLTRLYTRAISLCDLMSQYDEFVYQTYMQILSHSDGDLYLYVYHLGNTKPRVYDNLEVAGKSIYREGDTKGYTYNHVIDSTYADTYDAILIAHEGLIQKTYNQIMDELDLVDYSNLAYDYEVESEVKDLKEMLSQTPWSPESDNDYNLDLFRANTMAITEYAEAHDFPTGEELDKMQEREELFWLKNLWMETSTVIHEDVINIHDLDSDKMLEYIDEHTTHYKLVYTGKGRLFMKYRIEDDGHKYSFIRVSDEPVELPEDTNYLCYITDSTLDCDCEEYLEVGAHTISRNPDSSNTKTPMSQIVGLFEFSMTESLNVTRYHEEAYKHTADEDLDNLPETHIQGEDGKWYKCKPFVSTVKGGRAVIYTDHNGNEIKREPLARYTARANKEG